MKILKYILALLLFTLGVHAQVAVKANADGTILVPSNFFSANAGSIGTNFLLKASNLSDLANAGAARTNLGLVIGTNVQPYSSVLDTFTSNGSAYYLNASNITSGTLPAARLPNPSSSTLGGVKSITAASHQWLSYIDTSGVPHQSQLDYADITGLGSMATQSPSAVAITGGTITGMSNPSVNSDVATKGYVDSVSAGIVVKTSARVGTTTTLPANTYNNGSSGVGATLTANSTGTLTVDGVLVALNDYVLVKNEAAPANNGLYKCTTAGAGGVAYVLTRSTDMNSSTIFSGGYVFISSGSTQAFNGYVCTNTGSVTVGTTAITFQQFSGANVITAGTGLSQSGSVFSIDSTVVTLTGSQTLTNKSISAGQITGLATSATTDATNASNITSGTLPAARLPVPSSSTLGGVQSIAAVSHKFITSISTSGVPAQAQPAAGDITGLATSATTDTTNAANITSGTLPSARLSLGSGLTISGGQVAIDSTVVTLTGSQTLSNKSITAGQITGLSGLATNSNVSIFYGFNYVDSMGAGNGVSVLDISGLGFSGAPTFGVANCTSDSNNHIAYNWDDSTSTAAYFNSSNAGTYRISCFLGQ